VAGRRDFLVGVALVTVQPLASARATPASMSAAVRQVIGDATVQDGRIKLEIPPLVENGNAVPLTVSVDSPMTDADHVKAIHVFNEKNPQPHVFSALLTPRNGKAMVGTRIKLADSQQIMAIAETSDGRFWRAVAEIIVTTAACIEDMNN
jgi:sulfur-oxidizing protein SoxY